MLRLAEILTKKKVTQKSLALSLKTSNVSVHNWVKNRYQPSISTLYEIADILEISVYDLLTEKIKTKKIKQ